MYHVMIFTVDKSERMFYYLFEHLFQVYHPGFPQDTPYVLNVERKFNGKL